MVKTPLRILLVLITTALLLGAAGCRKASPPTPTITSTITITPTRTLTPTDTQTPTPTQTTTPAFTITPRPTKTPSITPTPYRTLSPTPSPSQVPPRPAVLFPYNDFNGKTVDWSYTHVTKIGFDRLNEVNNLWAFMSFQLLDRAIYQRSFYFLGKTTTVYYLNVAHDFDGEMVPMQLILGGSPGDNVSISELPAGGTAYIQVQVRESSDFFDPYTTHRDANRAYQLRETAYPLLFLKELQELLPTLPDELILLADHPILFPRNDWQQVKLDMGRVSYFTARYHPFFAFDPYDRLVDQSDFAVALKDHILHGREMPEGYFAFSSQTLIIIKGNP